MDMLLGCNIEVKVVSVENLIYLILCLSQNWVVSYSRVADFLIYNWN